MPEYHTVEFRRCSFNVISDAERRTLTLQFDTLNTSHKAIQKLLEAIERRFGKRTMRWFQWRRSDEGSPLLIRPGSSSRQVSPDVHRYEIGVRPGETMDSALGALLGFLRVQPEYQHTFGADLGPNREAPVVLLYPQHRSLFFK